MSALSSILETFGSVTERLMDKAIWLAAIAIGLLIALWLALHSLPSPISVTTTTEIQDILLGNIQAESLLTTASQKVNANVTVEKVAKIIGIPVGETNLVYAAVGKASAGIDLQDIEVVDFNKRARTVKLSIPAVEVSVSLNPERSETLANYRDWFGPKAGADIYEEAQREAYAIMKGRACSTVLLDTATQNAEYEIQTILTKVGFQAVEFVTAAPAKGACQAA